MKKYLLGGIAGYLLTSIFSIPEPPTLFWWTSALLFAIATYFYFIWWRLNNDTYGDIDE